VCDHSAAAGIDLDESELQADRLVGESHRVANDNHSPCRQLRIEGAIQPKGAEPDSCHADFRPLAADARGGHRQLPRRESSYPTRRASGRTLHCRAPFCASCMLMSAHGRRVEQQVFQVLATPEHFEKSLPDAPLRPSAVPLECRIPRAVSLRQVAPRRPGACKPQHSIDETPVVLGGAARIAALSRKVVFDQVPLHVRQFMSSHRLTPP